LCLIVTVGLGPAIHAFAARIEERRGWPAFAGHDEGEPSLRQLKQVFRNAS
jgi:hypothetical protein